MASSSGPACGHNFCRSCLSKCWTDTQTCFCPLCKDTFSRRPDLKINTTLRENQLVQTQTDVYQMIQDRMKKIQEIKHSVELRKRNTEKEKSSSVELFTDLIRSIERCQSEQLKMMEEQQKAAEKQAEDLIIELEQEITELKRRNTELEQLSHTDDHFHLIQLCQHLISHHMCSSLITALTELKKTLDGTLNQKLSQTGLKFVQNFAVDVTLDPDTANPDLILSEDGKQVRDGGIEQDVPENPKRFDEDLSVVAKQGFSSGRFYYEVQVKGKTEWDLGVARESINRKEEIIASPDDGLWALILRNENEYIACEYPPVSFSLRVKPEKVGVFVDYEEGLVSFYDVESRSHIYSFTGQTFTEKLYPFFSPYHNDKYKDKNSNPLIISPVSALMD